MQCSLHVARVELYIYVSSSLDDIEASLVNTYPFSYRGPKAAIIYENCLIVKDLYRRSPAKQVVVAVVVDDSHIQGIVLATEETTVTQRVSH